MIHLQEAVGLEPDIEDAVVVHLLSADIHSGLLSSVIPAPLNLNGGSGPIYSYERWIRLAMTPPFVSYHEFRFWVPDFVAEPGWLVTWGTTPSYQAPVNTISTVATSPIPTADPGSPNLNPGVVFTGDDVHYSDWVVLQARVDASATVGPMLGFNQDGVPVEIEYMFGWTETY